MYVWTSSSNCIVENLLLPIVAMVGNRGGKRNYVKGKVDNMHLEDMIKSYCSEQGRDAWQLDEYSTLWHSCQPRYHGLARLSKLIRALLAVSPSLTVLYSDLKSAIMAAFLSYPDLKPAKMTACDVATQVGATEAHEADLSGSSE